MSLSDPVRMIPGLRRSERKASGCMCPAALNRGKSFPVRFPSVEQLRSRKARDNRSPSPASTRRPESAAKSPTGQQINIKAARFRDFEAARLLWKDTSSPSALHRTVQELVLTLVHHQCLYNSHEQRIPRQPR